MSSPTNEIKEKLGIVDVLNSYLKLEKSGKNYKARCPFHNEKTPSFFVSPDRNSYYCFGCGAKGDIFSFVEQFEGVDFMGALRMLADKAGVALRFEPKEKKDERERLFDCMEASTKVFEANLFENKEALDYLKNRGLTDETIKNWRLGLAKDDWHDLETRLSSKGFRSDEMLRAGVIKKAEGGKIYDTFRNRIIFPIFDTTKRVVAFTGRILSNEKDVAKYLNSPETELFKKSEILYGLHAAKNGIRRLNFSILVEGQMDLLMCHQSGWDNAVATSGTALTDKHLEILKRLSSNIIIAYDNDLAGEKASLRAFTTALRMDFNVKAVRMSESKDPADLILKDKNEWKKAIKEARDIVSFAWENLLDEKLTHDKFIAKFRKVIVPLLASIPGDSEKMRLISMHQISIKTGIREEHLLEDIHKAELVIQSEDVPESKQPEKLSGLESGASPIRRLFGMLFASDKIGLEGVKFTDLEKEIKSISGDFYDILRDKYSKEKERLLFETETLYSGGVYKKELDELLKNFEDDILRERLLIKMRELQKFELSKDEKEVKRLLAECQEITKKLSALKQS
ncbi:MAG TPA: DNA primase [Candidatus Paceibacterota bacterium]